MGDALSDDRLPSGQEHGIDRASVMLKERGFKESASELTRHYPSGPWRGRVVVEDWGPLGYEPIESCADQSVLILNANGKASVWWKFRQSSGSSLGKKCDTIRSPQHPPETFKECASVEIGNIHRAQIQPKRQNEQHQPSPGPGE